MKKWLFVLAHPDDEADVGGTIYKLSRAGYAVAVALLVSKAAARSNLSSDLSEEEQKSMSVLGVSKVYHEDFPNIQMNTVPHIEIVSFIERCIRDWGAEAIVTHHSADVNIDHKVTSEAVMAACRLPQRKDEPFRLRLFLMCEVSGATEWSLDCSKNRFTPNYYVEIGREGLEVKWKAFSAYRGVPRKYPHPYSKESFEGLAAYRGAQSGCNYAEAFECVFQKFDPE